jgi:hypothetical protein
MIAVPGRRVAPHAASGREGEVGPLHLPVAAFRAVAGGERVTEPERAGGKAATEPAGRGPQ